MSVSSFCQLHREFLDYVMFYHASLRGIVLLLLYVDDMISTGSDPTAIVSLKQHLQSQFETKNLSHLCYFSGIEVGYSSQGCKLSQQNYISDILECAPL